MVEVENLQGEYVISFSGFAVLREKSDLLEGTGGVLAGVGGVEFEGRREWKACRAFRAVARAVPMT